MKVKPFDDRLLMTGIDDKEHAIVRRLLFLAGGLLRHAPACPICGLGESLCCSAQPGVARADDTTTATVPTRTRLRSSSPEARVG
jgi:hypothetical protein